MIDFLKESTFAVNDVVNKSWEILYKNYKNIAGLCFTMFVVLWMSGFLSGYTEKGLSVQNVVVLLIFTIVYSGLQLTLFKYILFAIDEVKADGETFTHRFMTFLKLDALKLILAVAVPFIFIAFMSILTEVLNVDGLIIQILTFVIGLLISIIIFWNQIRPFFFVIKEFWPTKTQLLNFLVGLIYALLVTIAILFVIAAIPFPLLYIIDIDSAKLAGAALLVGLFVSLIVLIRISFFPFFIVSMNTSPFKSIRFSLAVTRGNFTRLLLLIGLTVLFYLVGGYFQADGYYFLTLAISLVYFFIVIPLSSVAVAMAYKQMMNDYKGDADPDIIHNLI